MALTGEHTTAIKADVRHLRESASRDNLEERLEKVVEERPGVRPFLEPRPLAMAVGIAAVLTLIAALAFGLTLAALVLVFSFGIAWVVLSKRSYEERRPTRDPDEESEGSGKSRK
jgi:Flp pilus assembly protein TadB